MTLRQQPWDDEAFKILETALRMQGVKKPLTAEFYESYNELKAHCQEIAREARSDLAEAIVSNSIHTTGNKHSDSPNGTDTFTIDKTKLWELTQKPSKASTNPPRDKT